MRTVDQIRQVKDDSFRLLQSASFLEVVLCKLSNTDDGKISQLLHWNNNIFEGSHLSHEDARRANKMRNKVTHRFMYGESNPTYRHAAETLLQTAQLAIDRLSPRDQLPFINGSALSHMRSTWTFEFEPGLSRNENTSSNPESQRADPRYHGIWATEHTLPPIIADPYPSDDCFVMLTAPRNMFFRYYCKDIDLSYKNLRGAVPKETLRQFVETFLRLRWRADGIYAEVLTQIPCRLIGHEITNRQDVRLAHGLNTLAVGELKIEMFVAPIQIDVEE